MHKFPPFPCACSVCCAYDPTIMPQSGESNSNKCLSTFLSRLLCSGGLPTHPSEQLIESNTVDQKPLESAKRGSDPGVVARLMGLESFPAENHHTERTLGDYFRSRSVNSIDFLSHLDPVKPRNHRHRRVRTSVSFRDGFDDELARSVVFLLEEEFQAKMRERNRVDEREVQEERKSVYGKNVVIIKEKRKPDLKKKKKDLEGKRRPDLKERRPAMKSEGKLKKKKKKISAPKLNFDFKKIQSEGSAPEVACPRKHETVQTADSHSPCTNSSLFEGMIIKEKNEGKMEKNENLCYKKVEEICGLAEECVRDNWIYGMELNFGNFEEICQQFGQDILEVLLTQFVDELFV